MIKSYRQVCNLAEIKAGQDAALQYNYYGVSGWAGQKVAKDAFYLLSTRPGNNFVKLSLPYTSGSKMMLYNFCRKVLGKDTLNYPQEIGDCVSFGAKNACEYIICVQKALGLAPDEFRPVFPPYLYGCGRVFVGEGQMGNDDGSVGSWQAEAVQKYGVLAADEPNVPEYSGSVAKQWGYSSNSLNKFTDLGKVHPVKSAAQVTTWKEVVAAVSNGYPVTVASNQGFTMEPGNDGFHRPSGTWGHQMCIIGVDDSYKKPYGIILNSWGDVMGQLKDFDTGEELPVGCIRATSDVIEGMVGQEDSFAYSHMNWFEEQKFSPDLFKLI